MQQAIRIIRDEHRSISAVLSGLKSLVQMAQDSPVRPGFEVFRAMIVDLAPAPIGLGERWKKAG